MDAMKKLVLTEDIHGDCQTPLGLVAFALKKGTLTAKSEQDEAVFAFLADVRPDIAAIDTPEAAAATKRAAEAPELPTDTKGDA